MKLARSGYRTLSVSMLMVAALLVGATGALLGVCGPFTDVSDAGFCPFVLEVFFVGVTTGTSPTTYDPAGAVSRLQMAAFLSRSIDASLRRGSRRAALGEFWTPRDVAGLALTTIGLNPELVRSDGVDLWVAGNNGIVSRVRGGDGKYLETWTGATKAYGVLSALGNIFVTGSTIPGSLYRIEPRQTAGAVSTVAGNLGDSAAGIAFDGVRIWTANIGGSVSIVTPAVNIPWTAVNVSTGFTNPVGAIYDGSNVWVTDGGPNALLKLDANGAILQTVSLAGSSPLHPAFDGANLWVPDFVSNRVFVVRASNGTVLQTLTGNGLSNPFSAAFDGQRVLVTNNGGDSVSLWKAANLTGLGEIDMGPASQPLGACSDGVNFWVVLQGVSRLARF